MSIAANSGPVLLCKMCTSPFDKSFTSLIPIDRQCTVLWQSVSTDNCTAIEQGGKVAMAYNVRTN